MEKFKRISKASLFWRLFPSYLLVAAVSLGVVLLLAAKPLRQFYINATEASLQTTLNAIQDHFITALSSEREQGERLTALVRQTGSDLRVRVTLIAPDGKVLADSRTDRRLDNHLRRPEVVQALRAGDGTAVRYSRSLDEEELYRARALYAPGHRLLGVVRLASPLKTVAFPFYETMLHLGLNSLAILALAAVLSLYLAGRISRPLGALRVAAERVAGGDLSCRLPVPRFPEMAALAESMNHMAAELIEKIEIVGRQRNELDTVLESMIEGVIAVDTEGRVRNINRAAARFLGSDAGDVRGKYLEEIVRSAPLADLLYQALHAQDIQKVEFTLRSPAPREITAYARQLIDGAGNRIGALVALNDVTQLRRLENIRRDFVANVSHELRTPITAIQGFVDTLLEGAMEQPEDLKRFLEIIARQSKRLNGIIEDLLVLARLEHEPQREPIEQHEDRVLPVLQSAIEQSSLTARKKKVELTLDCPAALTVTMNGPLVEQAVANLIDNAIKYSAEGATIDITGEAAGEFVRIAVRDYGCGIDPEHLPRLFERFYRVDKARSRDLGGTGLGLSLVKHIAQLHGGHPEVQSVSGAGSTFSIYLRRDGGRRISG